MKDEIIKNTEIKNQEEGNLSIECSKDSYKINGKESAVLKAQKSIIRSNIITAIFSQLTVFLRFLSLEGIWQLFTWKHDQSTSEYFEEECHLRHSERQSRDKDP